MKEAVKPDKRDAARSVVYILAYVSVLGSSAFALLPEQWILWAAIAVGGLILLVNWHKEKTAYQCPNCGHFYEISFLTDLSAPHGFNREGGWLYLRCPKCGQRHKTMVLKKAA